MRNRSRVIGSGYVGIELSQAMRRFGSNVSVVGRSEQLMSRLGGEKENIADDQLNLSGSENASRLTSEAVLRE